MLIPLGCGTRLTYGHRPTERCESRASMKLSHYSVGRVLGHLQTARAGKRWKRFRRRPFQDPTSFIKWTIRNLQYNNGHTHKDIHTHTKMPGGDIHRTNQNSMMGYEYGQLEILAQDATQWCEEAARVKP